LYTNMEELDPYFEMFDSIYLVGHKPTPKELDNLRMKGMNGGPYFVEWFHEYVIISL
jgi:hypothetical protein